MDGENDSVEVIVARGAKRTIRGKEYSLLCQRQKKSDAEKVVSSLKADGCSANISQDNGLYSVWWTK